MVYDSPLKRLLSTLSVLQKNWLLLTRGSYVCFSTGKQDLKFWAEPEAEMAADYNKSTDSLLHFTSFVYLVFKRGHETRATTYQELKDTL